jgi:uncharacterized protein
MNHDAYPDDYIRSILTSVRTIAVVGASANPTRASFIVPKYLRERGYAPYAVNPALAGQELHGAPAFARLADIPFPIDMVDIFRNAEAAAGVVDEALQMRPLPKVIWMQLGVRNDAAAAKAESAGVAVVMNRCPKIEYGRFSGEIGWGGVNSRIVTARRPQATPDSYQKLGLNKP